MIASFGELTMWLAWLISGFAAVLGYVAHDPLKAKKQLPFLWSLSTTSFALILFGFFSLLYVFLTSDFSVWLVVKHSHENLPWYYKMGASWGNHEGSMLLWVLVLSLLAVVLLWRARRWADDKKHKSDGRLEIIMGRVVATQQSMVFLFLAYMLFTSNPFLQIPAPAEGGDKMLGLDLNPLLQDPGLIFHPPALYGGFVGLSAIFSIAVGIMFGKNKKNSGKKNSGKKNNDTIPPELIGLWRWFAQLAFVFLTLGILGGSFWAYYELGWGGYWFWDPVENVSLIPWLLAVALIHSIMVHHKTGQLKMSCLLLSLLTFSTSLVGTFLVRSGLLTSVHSFASDPNRGIFLLAVVALLIGGGFFLWLRYYYRSAMTTKPINLFSRHGLLVINNMIFYIIAGVIFVGLIYPLLLSVISGEDIAVGAPFFNITVLPFFAVLGLLLALGFFLPDNHNDMKKNIAFAWKKTKPFLWTAMAIGFLSGTIFFQKFFAICFGVGLSCWLLLVAGRDGMTKIKQGITFLSAPIAHAGFGLMMMGVVASSQLANNQDFMVSDQSNFSFQGQDFKVDGMFLQSQQHFNSLQVRLVSDGMTLTPEKRIYLVGGQEVSEVAIHSNLFVNYYAAIGDIDIDKKQLMIRFYYQPLVMFIFLGGLLMAVAGGLALLHRSKRIHGKIHGKIHRGGRTR